MNPHDLNTRLLQALRVQLADGMGDALLRLMDDLRVLQLHHRRLLDLSALVAERDDAMELLVRVDVRGRVVDLDNPSAVSELLEVVGAKEPSLVVQSEGVTNE